jgi:hypothetical protein
MTERDNLKILSLEKIYRGELTGETDVEITDEERAVIEKIVDCFVIAWYAISDLIRDVTTGGNP